jgi:hypothetical protein
VFKAKGIREGMVPSSKMFLMQDMASALIAANFKVYPPMTLYELFV